LELGEAADPRERLSIDWPDDVRPYRDVFLGDRIGVTDGTVSGTFQVIGFDMVWSEPHQNFEWAGMLVEHRE
jgi:hypothetical protein